MKFGRVSDDLVEEALKKYWEMDGIKGKFVAF